MHSPRASAIRISASVHASPSKTGNNTEPVTGCVIHEKEFVNAAPAANGTWDVLYSITVSNTSATKSTAYTLTDQPIFDNDITIISASYTSTVPTDGALGRYRSVDTGHNRTLAANSRHVYMLTVNVSMNLVRRWRRQRL